MNKQKLQETNPKQNPKNPKTQTPTSTPKPRNYTETSDFFPMQECTVHLVMTQVMFPLLESKELSHEKEPKSSRFNKCI